jgi:hypothetical protein
MRGLVPRIHVFSGGKDVDGRDEPGHDGVMWWRAVYRIMPDRRNEEIIAESSRYR